MKRFCKVLPHMLVYMLLMVLTGTGTVAAKITITHLGYPGHGQAWRDYVDQAATDFMAQNPDIQIDVIIAAGSYGDKMRTMYVTDAGLDVIELGRGAAVYANQGMFLDLKPYITRDREVGMNAWPQPVIEGFTVNNQVFGLPASLALWMTWFNRDLFNQAGLRDPHALGDAWTWDTMVSSAKKMTIDTNGDDAMDQYGVDRAATYWQYGLAAVAGGAQMYERFTLPLKPNVNSPAAVKALDWVADLFLTHKVTPPYGSAAVSQFYLWGGKSAIDVVDNPGIVGAYMKNVNFDWDVALPVAGPGGRATHLQIDGFEAMSNTKNPDAVWKWLKFLIARRESVEKFTSMTGRLPAFKGVHARYKQLIPYAPKSWLLMFQQMDSPATYPVYVHQVPGFNQWGTATLMSSVFTGQKAAKTALDEIQDLELANVKDYLEQQKK